MPAIPINSDQQSYGQEASLESPSRLEAKLLIDRLIHQFERSTPRSSTGLKIVELTGKANAEFDEIEAVLRTDPVLVTKVFKLANSSLYAANASSSLAEACVKLGLKTIRNISVACSMSQSFHTSLKNYQLKENELLKHSLTVALCGQNLSKLLKKPASFQADIFLAGIMHDIGKSLVDSVLTNSIEAHGVSGVHLELTDIGTTHTEVGGKFTTYWNLPPSVCHAASNHHVIDSDHECADYAAVINLSDLIAHHVVESCEEDESPSISWDATALEALDLDSERMDLMAEEIISHMDSIEASVNDFVN